MPHPPLTRVALAVFFVFLALPPPVPASPYGLEYDAAFEAMMEDPTDLDATFTFAVIARRVGDLEGAVGALERMLIFNPNLPVVHYELARLYARLGSREAALRYFRSALSYDPPTEIRAEIEAEIAVLDRAARTGSLSGSASLALQYQTNANAAPDDPTVRVGGIDARLADEFLGQGDVSAVASARLVHRHDLGRDPAAFIVSEVGAYGSRQSDLDENNFELVAGTLGAEFVRSNQVSLRPHIRTDLTRLGAATYYRSFGAGITGRGPLPAARDLLYFFDATAIRRDFRKSDRSPALDRRDGYHYRVEAGLQGVSPAALRIAGSAGWERQDSQAKAESYSGASLAVRVQRPLPAPFGSRQWSLFAAGRGTVRRYDSPDPTIDPRHRRNDRSIALSLGLAIPFSESAAFTVEGSQRWRRSDLPNFDYKNTTVSAGVRFSF